MSTTLRTGVPALTLALLAWSGIAPAQEAGKRLGERLDEAGREARAGLNRAGQEIKGGFAAAKSSVQSMGVEARVYSRLHWDKALNTATIELTVTKEGVVTLKGSVPSVKAKTRAAELAEETMGVTGVVDQLAVAGSMSNG